MNICVSSFMLFALFAGLMTGRICLAADLPDNARQVIEDQFPGAKIIDMEIENSKGQTVVEVQLISQDRIYEMHFTKEGELLKVEQEIGLPIIGGELAVGIALRIEKEIYKGENVELEPSAFFLYERGPMKIRAYDGFEAAWHIYREDAFYIALCASLDMDEGYDTDDSDYLNGMKELKTLYDAGFQMEATFGGCQLSFDFNQDLSGEHKGREMGLSISYTKIVANFELKPQVNVTWMSGKKAHYLYGVSTAEARPDRPAYSPDGGFEIGAELMIQHSIVGDLSAVSILCCSYFSSEITGSPIVDKDYEIEAVLGVMHRF